MTPSPAWPHISLVSIVDILLVAILIYQLLALIRGTRAAPMLLGLAVLALAFYFARLGELLKFIASGEISGKIAKDVFAKMLATGDGAATIIEREGLKQISDSGAIEKIVDEVIAANRFVAEALFGRAMPPDEPEIRRANPAAFDFLPSEPAVPKLLERRGGFAATRLP